MRALAEMLYERRCDLHPICAMVSTLQNRHQTSIEGQHVAYVERV